MVVDQLPLAGPALERSAIRFSISLTVVIDGLYFGGWIFLTAHGSWKTVNGHEMSFFLLYIPVLKKFILFN
jgi:hypothetical protein